MVLQTICHLQGKLVCKTPPLASPTTVVQIRHWEPMQGLMHLARASHGLACEVCMPSTRTTCEPRPHLIPTLARCACPAASPDTHVHTCSDVVTRLAPSCPYSPDMHGRSVLDAHGLTHRPACLPALTSPPRPTCTYTAHPRLSHGRSCACPPSRSPSHPLHCTHPRACPLPALSRTFEAVTW
jgi:hypothetical protein